MHRSKLKFLIVPALLAVLFAVFPILLNLVVFFIFVITEIVFIFRKKLVWLSLSRVGVFVSILFVAYLAPVKYLDTQVNPTTLELISDEYRTYIKGDSVYIRFSSAYTEKDFDLGNELTSVRNLLQRLETQTGSKPQVLYCGTGASLLFGGAPMDIYFDKDT